MATIKKRGKSYLLRCYDGYDASGKQIERTMTWTPPSGMSAYRADKEAKHQAELFEEKVRTGQVADKRIKFCDFVNRWFSDYANLQLRPTTLARYHDLMTRVEPVFGHMYMDKIRPAHLMDFYKKLSETPIRTKAHCKINLKSFLKQRKITKETCAAKADVGISVLTSIYQGKNIDISKAKQICKYLQLSYSQTFDEMDSGKMLSTKTIQNYHRLLSSIMHCAVKWQVIVSNPCDRVDPPRVKKTAVEYLDVQQANHMLDLLQTEPVPFRCAAEVLLYTGMRRGELLGLKWSDIDFAHQLVNIDKSSLYLSDKGIFEDDTKNASSRRVIKVPDAAIKSFRRLRLWQSEQRLALGNQWTECGNVFTSRTGSPMHPDTLSNWFHRFISKTDLPQIHLHCLRHTAASLYIANGVPITAVAANLGHANASTTAKIYAHSIQSAQAAAADLMDDLLSGDSQKKQCS